MTGGHDDDGNPRPQGSLWGLAPDSKAAPTDPGTSYPPQAFVVPPPVPPASRRTAVWLTVGIAAAVAVAATAVVLGVVQKNRGQAVAAEPTTAYPTPTYFQPPAVAGTDSYDPTTTDDPYSTTPSSADPTTEPPVTAVDGYHEVTGSNGMAVLVPAQWSVKAGSVASNPDVEDPAHANVVARFGGAPPETPDTLSTIVASNETENPAITAGYQRITLEDSAFGSAEEAVEWEFTYDKNGSDRHARALYWRLAGIDYVIYVSAPAKYWYIADHVFEVMRSSATPR